MTPFTLFLYCLALAFGAVVIIGGLAFGVVIALAVLGQLRGDVR